MIIILIHKMANIKKKENNTTPLFVVGGVFLAIILFSSVIGAIIGIIMSIISNIIIYLFYGHKEVRVYIKTYLLCTIFFFLIFFIKLNIFYDFKIINIWSWGIENIKYIYKNHNNDDVLYIFIPKTKEIIYYNISIAFAILSLSNFIFYRFCKTNQIFKSVKALKKGNIILKKDKITQSKLYEICKNKVNPLKDEIGVDVNNGKPFVFNDYLLKYILLILGKTGAGKTELLKNFYYRTIQRKLPLIIVNAKPDKDLEQVLMKWCEEKATKMWTFGCVNFDNYDFLNLGGQTLLTDKILSLNNDWENIYYKIRATVYIQQAIYILQNTNYKNETLTLKDFIDCFYYDRLVKKVDDYKKNFLKINDDDNVNNEDYDDNFKNKDNNIKSNNSKKTNDKYKHLTLEEKEKLDLLNEFLGYTEKIDTADLQGLLDIFMLLYTSEFRDWLSSNKPQDKTFSLKKVIENREVIYFSIDVLTYPTFAPLIGMLVSSDLKSFLTQRTKEEIENEPIVFIGDEVGAFASINLKNLINMGRGLGLYQIYGTQTLNDLDNIMESFRKIVMSNISSIAIHTVPEPDEADYISRWIGTKQAINTTAKLDENNDYQASINQVDTFIINPNELKRELGGGKAFIIDTMRRIEKKIQVALVNDNKK